MTILIQPGEVTREHGSLTANIEGREYYLFVARTGYVTVIAGKITRRSLGKTFWNTADLAAHYKQHGSELVRLAAEVGSMMNAAGVV